MHQSAHIAELAQAYSAALAAYYADEANPRWRAEILANGAALKERFNLRPTRHELSYYGPYYPSVLDHYETHVMHGAKIDGHQLYMFICAPYFVDVDTAKTTEKLISCQPFGFTIHDKPVYHHACVTLYRIGTLPALKAWLIKPECG